MSLALGKLLVVLLQLIIALIPWRTIAVKIGLPMHDYRYRNPYDRTCTKCGQHEQSFCWDMADFHRPGASWWEEMHPGYRGSRCSGSGAYEEKRRWPDDHRHATNAPESQG